LLKARSLAFSTEQAHRLPLAVCACWSVSAEAVRISETPHCRQTGFQGLFQADMKNLVVVGAQWGDEGKGKVVDILAPHFDIVARYQGGHNAGHTVRIGERKFILRLIPSGILHEESSCVIGNGVVVDPRAFNGEVQELREMGIECAGRLFISSRAHLILPYHAALDRAREALSS